MSPINRAEDLQDNPLIEALCGIVEDYYRDYEFPRQYLLREIRRNDLYYMDIQNIWISDDARDWRSFEDIGSLGASAENENLNSDFNFKFVNVYKAFADTLIAALSTSVPPTRFLPEDADNIDDIQTAEAYGKLAELIRKNNRAKILLIQLLAILYNHGCVCVYNYADRDAKYGTVENPIRGLVNKATVTQECSQCGNELSAEVLPAEAIQDIEALSGGMSIGEEMVDCPNCGIPVQPILNVQPDVKEGIVDYEVINKVRVIQKAYGLTHCSFAPFVKEQSQIPVFTFEHEEDISLIESIYPHLKGKIAETNSDTPEENKWARQNYLYYGELPKHTCTVRESWIRPWAYNRIKDDAYIVEMLGNADAVPEDIVDPLANEADSITPNIPLPVEDNEVETAEPEQIDNEVNEQSSKLSKYLQQKYPKGLRLVCINRNIYADHHEEDLDQAWTVSLCPTQQWLIAKSAGSGMIPIQDTTNDVFNLTVDTINNGIPENYVDQGIIDWPRYSLVENRPGNTFPVEGVPGQRVSDSFHQTKPASLSSEVPGFADKVQGMGEFVSGATPALFGMMDSETAAQDSMSRAQALQRLLLSWASICELWSQMECKSVKLLAENLNYDERFVKSEGNTAKNVWVKQIELKGKIADIEPEASEAFPLTWAQKSDLIFKLLTLGNERINEILDDPENRNIISTYIGSSELYIPGNDQRNKQLAEINELVKIPAEAIEILLQSNQSTVLIEPELDDNEVHSGVCKAFLIGIIGQALKRDNPAAYLNVLLHKRMHDMAIAEAMKQEMALQAELAAGSNDKNGGEKDVQPIAQ